MAGNPDREGPGGLRASPLGTSDLRGPWVVLLILPELHNSLTMSGSR